MKRIMSKILLVDDSRVMRRMLRTAVVATGSAEFAFLEAANGKEALEVLEEADFSVDLIFCDLCMPEMGGLELLQALAERDVLDACPVIILTGDAREAQAQEALGCGARRLIAKPFTTEALAEALDEVLHPAG
jgi:two-component system chemotaxis response regulator CheY